MDGTTQLLESDRRYLVHPLHHPDDHRQPLVVVEGKGAMLRDAEGREYIDGLSGSVERQCRPRPGRAGRCGGGADAADRLRLGLYRRHQRAGGAPRRKDRRPRLSEFRRRLFHDGGRRIERIFFQIRALLLEGQRQAAEDQDHLAHPRLSRRDDGGDERHRHGGLSQDVRAARAGLHPGRRRPMPIAGPATRSRGSAPPMRSKRRSSPRGPTLWRRSSPSR